MRQLLTRIIFPLLILAMTLLPIVTVQPAAALIGGASQAAACSGINLDNNTKACGSDSASSLSSILATVINILSLIAGVVSIIMIIIGGFKYITSGGDSAQTGSAKNTIIYALVGLLIVVFAQALVHFVLHRSTCATSSAGTAACAKG